MTKNRKPRTVQGMRGDVLERIQTYSKYTNSNDFVFVDNNSGNQLTKDYYYRAWKFMMKNTGLDMGVKEFTAKAVIDGKAGPKLIGKRQQSSSMYMRSNREFKT